MTTQPLVLTETLPEQPLPAAAITLQRDSGISATDNVTNDARLTLPIFEVGAKLSYTLKLNGKALGKENSPLPADINTVMSKLKTDGNYEFSLFNSGADAGKLAFTLDKKAPKPLKVSLLNDSGKPKDGITNDAMLKLGGLEDGATLEWRAGPKAAWQTVDSSQITVSKAGISVHFASLLEDGFRGQLEFRQVDRAGNAQKTPAKLKLTYDNTAPVFEAGIQPMADSIANGKTAVVRLISNEELLGLDKNDFVIDNPALGSVKGVKATKLKDGKVVYDVTVSAAKQGGGVISLSLAKDAAATDLAGNALDFSQYADKTATFWVGNGNVGVRLLEDTGISNNDGVTNNGSIEISGMRPNATLEFRLKEKSQSEAAGSEWQTLEIAANKVAADAAALTVDVAQLYAQLGIDPADAPFSGWRDTFEFRQVNDGKPAAATALTLTYDGDMDVYWGEPPLSDELDYGATAVLNLTSAEKLYDFTLADLFVSDDTLLSLVGIKEQMVKADGETLWNYAITVKATKDSELGGEVEVGFAEDAIITDLAGNTVELQGLDPQLFFIGELLF